MSILDDYTGEDVSLDDMLPTTYNPALDNKSKHHLAGVATFVSSDLSTPEAVANSFKQMRESLSFGDSGPTLSAFNEVKEKARQGLVGEAMSFLGNPTATDEQKKQVIGEVTNPFSSLYSDQRLVANKAAVQSEANTPAKEFQLDEMLGLVDQVISVNQEAQKIINAQAQVVKEQGVFATAFDVAETAVPFASGIQAGTIASEVEGTNKLLEIAKSSALLGETRAAMSEYLTQLPIQERYAAIQGLAKVIKENPRVLIQSSNQLAMLDNLIVSLDRDYSFVERAVDDASSLLDILGVGGLIKGPKALLKSATTLSKVSSAAAKAKIIKGGASPISVLETVKAIDPAQARGIYHVATESVEEGAEALAATSRAELVAEKNLPNPHNVEGVILSEVDDIGRIKEVGDMPAFETMRYLNQDTQVYWSAAEKRRAEAKVFNDFANATGIKFHPNMSQIGMDDAIGKVSVKAVYAKPSGYWDNADEAVEQTMLSLREYGIRKDQVKVGIMNGNAFIPAEELEKALAEGTVQGMKVSPQYVTYVDYIHNFSPIDIEKADTIDVALNLLDRFRFTMTNRRGSLTRGIFNPSSIFGKHEAGAAMKAEDRTSRIAEVLKGDWEEHFVKQYAALPEGSKTKLFQYFLEANQHEIPFSPVQMRKAKFTEEEIDVARRWRRVWDNAWYLLNREHRTRLKDSGYGFYENNLKGHKLVGKRVGHNNISNDVKVVGHDGEETILSSYARKDFDDGVYELVKLKRPVDDVEYAVASNKKGEGVWRTFNDNDKLLSYRHGYFHVKWKGNIYIDRTMKNAEGVEYTKAIATYTNRKEAELAMKDFARNGNIDPSELKIRYAKEDLSVQSDEFDDMVTAYGLSPQKYRGEVLTDATGAPLLGNSDVVLDPIESVAYAISSVSRKVGMGDYISAMMKKFEDNFGDLYDSHTGKWPRVDELYSREVGQTHRVADARTTLEYINFLRHGYLNDLDVVAQASLEGLAKIFGLKGATGLEKATYAASKKRPTKAARSAAFLTSIVANPTRQAVLQASQQLLLTSVNPTYVLKGQSIRDSLAIATYIVNGKRDLKGAAKVAGRELNDFKQAIKDLEDSGLLASITRQNLVASGIEKMSDVKGGKSGLFTRTTETLRRYGFETGEAMNMASAFMCFRDKALKEGKVLTRAVLQDDVALPARNFTFGMNRADDMPYNSNMLALSFQFFQVPHKAALMATNRMLTPQQKIAFLATNAALWGSPFVEAPDIFASILPDDPDARELVDLGLMNYILNGMLSTVSGQDVSLNWKSSFAPLQLDFMFELARLNLFDAGAIAERAPAVTLLKRMVDATQFMYTQRYENLDDYLNTALEFGKLLSGVSQVVKARYAYEMGELIDKNGELTDEQVSKVEAFLISTLGVRTMDEVRRQTTLSRLYRDSEHEKNDIDIWYNTMKRILTADGLTYKDYQRHSMILSEFGRAFGNDPKAYQMLMSKIKSDLSRDPSLVMAIFKQIGLKDDTTLLAAINDAPNISPEMKERLRENVKYFKEQRELKIE